MSQIILDKIKDLQTSCSLAITYSPDSKYLLFGNGNNIVVYDSET